MAADRTRNADVNRTPVALPPDAIDLFGTQADVSDFAPVLASGLTGAGSLNVSSQNNIFYDGGFAEGVGDWTAPGASSVTTDQANNTAGTAELVVALQPAFAGNIITGLRAIPDGTAALDISFDVRFHKVSSTGVFADFTVTFYDSSGSSVQAMSGVTPTRSVMATDTWYSTAVQLLVPAGAVQYKLLIVPIADASFVVNETWFVQNVIVAPAQLFVGAVDGRVSPHSKGIVGMRMVYDDLAGLFATYPTAFAVSVLDAGTVWGITIVGLSAEETNGEHALDVHCVFTCTAVGTAGATVPQHGRVRVDISLDGGATWTTGRYQAAQTYTSVAMNMPITAQMAMLGVKPTQDIWVRAVVLQHLGTAGTTVFGSNGENGVMCVTVQPHHPVL